MKVYAFGEENAPVILLLPGTCCHWKGNFGHVIPLLSDEYRVFCVSFEIHGKIADESSAVADVPDAARRQVQVAASAKARGKADAADG